MVISAQEHLGWVRAIGEDDWDLDGLKNEIVQDQLGGGAKEREGRGKRSCPVEGGGDDLYRVISTIRPASPDALR